MSTLKIIADEKIPFLNEFFAKIGRLDALPASEISQKNIKSYDVLLVRTVTRVNSELLKDTRIKIVGSMTSGTDHIDKNYLTRKKIKLLYAPGSNARSVAEYVLTTLLILAQKKKMPLSDKTIGIIGVGNIGTMVERFCNALGIKVLLSDPPKYNRTKNRKYLSFNRLSDADIITLHIPLTFKGKYKTFHLVDEDFLKNIKNGTILINTSRGAVIDEAALIRFRKKLAGLIIDVWENEPNINIGLLKIVDIGTPHIAGYSLDGKFNASYTVYKKLCKLLKVNPEIKREDVLPEMKRIIDVSTKERDLFTILNRIMLQVYNPLFDYNNLMEIINIEPTKQKKYFEELRRNYPVRREFINYILKFYNTRKNFEEIISRLELLGFQVM